MSDSQAYEPVTVSSDGVAVAKRFEADEFPVPAIAFRITSNRDEPVSIRLVDSVPEDVAVEDLGFHPEYGSEFWTIDDQQITFERDLDANTEYTTVYGIRSTGTDNVEQFLTEPVIEMIDPPLPEGEGDVLDDSGSDIVKDVIAGESDSVPGLDDDEEIETLNLKDPTAPEEEVGGAEATETAETAEAEAGGGGGATAATNVTRALLAEIKRGQVDEEILAALRKTLTNGTGAGEATTGGALDARIQHLQNQMADLTAYTDSLEEFLAENGTGDEMIEEFNEQLNSFQNELDQIQSMTVENSDGVEDVQGAVSEIGSRVESVDDSVGSLESQVDEISGRVDEISGELSAVGDRVEEMDGDIDAIGDHLDETSGDVESFEDNIESLEGEVQGLREDLDGVHDRIDNVENVDEQIADIEDEIEELKEWREQLSSVLG